MLKPYLQRSYNVDVDQNLHKFYCCNIDVCRKRYALEQTIKLGNYTIPSHVAEALRLFITSAATAVDGGANERFETLVYVLVLYIWCS